MATDREYIQSELIVIRYLNGDAEAFDELAHAWEQPLFYYIRRLVDSDEDAWDTMQEVWIKVSRKIRRLRDPAAFPAWVYKLARRCAIDHLRKDCSRKFVSEVEAAPDCPADQGAAASLDLDAEELHWGLDQLSHYHREVLILHYLEGFRLAQIVDITGVPVGTVKSRIYCAKKALREVLKQERSHHE